jgi:agmatine deiminase
MKSDIPGKTPEGSGYMMPAEWEKHEGIWLAWPHDPDTFPDRVEKVENIYVQIIKSMLGSEQVHLLVKDDPMKIRVARVFKENNINCDKIHFFIFDYADVWIRDYGPIFVTSKQKDSLAMVRWRFNAWGEKYEDLIKDTAIPAKINRAMQLPCFDPQMVLEGGSIDVNGKGTLLTTEQCLLNRNRNPDLSKQEIEDKLKDYLGVTHIIWLRNGVYGDDTDGHIDDIARFVNPTTIVCAYEEDEADVNYPFLKENYELLLEAKDQDGNQLDIIKMPMPGFVGDDEGRLPASYTNFYIGNTVVLAPIFGHDNDQQALDILKCVFPGRTVVGILCNDLVYGFGAIHCITQQQPGLNV